MEMTIQTIIQTINLVKFLLLGLLLFYGATIAFGQSEPQYICNQPKGLRDSFIAEAAHKQYNIVRVQFVGNERLNARELFKITKPIIDEGDIFTRRKLEVAVKRVSKIKTIYPLTMDNIEVKLN